MKKQLKLLFRCLINTPPVYRPRSKSFHTPVEITIAAVADKGEIVFPSLFLSLSSLFLSLPFTLSLSLSISPFFPLSFSLYPRAHTRIIYVREWSATVLSIDPGARARGRGEWRVCETGPRVKRGRGRGGRANGYADESEIGGTAMLLRVLGYLRN